ncbi:alcohol oxidase [Serendipita vermifera]|nr:alcohol oxidase [Serendipita vermifera]
MQLPAFAILLATIVTPPAYGALLVGRDVQIQEKYDFVIVGGGTSGLVVANRLTENSNKTVLVIESGELDQGEESVYIPYLAFGGTLPKFLYNLTSIPQTQLNNRTFGSYTAHVVGGGSAINGMFFDRGSKGDYDLWKALGNQGWGWDDLLPYFKKSETFHPPDPALAQQLRLTYDPNAHGTSGPIHSSYPPFLYPATRNFLSAIEEFGSHVPLDGTSGDALGAFWVPNTLDPSSMTRSFARTAYYNPASSRSNLHLLTSTTVTKILIQNKMATGVQFAAAKDQPVQTVKARCEVILAAGSQHTPQLLLLSGIGDKTFLKSLGVDVVSDLPGVGQNFQDHTAIIPVAPFMNDLNPSPNNATNATWVAEQRVLYDTEKKGIWTTSASNSGAFLPLGEFTNRSAEFITTLQGQNPASYLPTNNPNLIAGAKEQIKQIIKGIQDKKIAFAEIANGATATTLLVLEKPFSRGTVTINSTDPFANPIIDFRALSNPVDMDVVVEIFKAWRKLLTMPSWAVLEPVEIVPGANVTSDDDLKSFIRSNALPTISHPCGTAAMMPKNLGGVVGSDLKVYGVNGLSVIDASIIPVIPSTHLVSTVYAVSEKAADLIRKRNRMS